MKYIIDGVEKTQEQFEGMLTDEQYSNRCFEVIDLIGDTIEIETYVYGSYC